NGITGTWSPAINNTATTTYTFTPTAGQCATIATLSIAITPNLTPNFPSVGPYCLGANIPSLPSTSINGITGTWSHAINNQLTTTYTFTPDVGNCAESVSLTISISSLGNCGCTNPQACNFNPVATLDNGLCLYYGCLDPAACNFNSNAGCNDGSCVYPGCNIIGACNYNAAALCGDSSLCDFPGCINPNACNYDSNAGCSNNTCQFPGCTDATACNFLASAGCDNGSCTYAGCTNPNACNYDTTAGCSNNSCQLPGCTDATACNFLASAGCDNGSCTYAGCTNPIACNYDTTAGCENGSCILPVCNEPSACNYNSAALCGDIALCEFPATGYNCAGVCVADADSNGVCDFIGCMDTSACNFEPIATDSSECFYPLQFLDCDGQCLLDMDSDGICDALEIAGCQDTLASNYNVLATDSGLCYYTPFIQVYLDIDGNGFLDSTDYGVPNFPLQVVTSPDNGEYIIYTNAGGFLGFAFPSNVEMVELSISNLLGFSSASIPNAVAISDSVFSIGILDTLLIPLALSNDATNWSYELGLNNALLDTISCNENILSSIQIQNNGLSSFNVEIFLDLSPAFTAGYQFSEIVYPGGIIAQTAGGSLVWQLTEIQPLGSVLPTFALVPFTVADGTEIPFTYYLTFTDTAGNTLGFDTLHFDIVTGCDIPEENTTITAEPPGFYEPNFVPQGELVDYYINFNVASDLSGSGIPEDDVSRDDCGSVYRVLISDTVDGLYFDLATIELFSNSDIENCSPSINYISDTQVEILFDFNSVSVTGDTVDGVSSYVGFAAFSVRLREDLPAGTEVVNQAWLRVLNEADSSCIPPAITNEYLHTVYECNFQVPDSDTICSNDGVTIDATQDYVDTYLWSSEGTNVTGAQYVFPPSSFGNFELTLATSNALCSDTNVVYVEIKEVPVIAFITNDTIVCEGDGLQLLVTTNNSDDSIFWNSGVTNGDTIFPGQPDNAYTVYITGPSGCDLQETVSVEYNLLPDSISYDSIGSSYFVEYDTQL
ncbi:MAG: hypothetical protein ACKOW8_06890, partial [Flavobacteriales bacterium]